MRFLRSSLVLGALLTITLPAAAQTKAAEGPWMIRLRALSLTPANQSDAIPSLGVAADKITINSKIFPEVDISYFFAPHFAAELVLTYPQKQDVKLNGNKIGTFYHLPPSLLAQYHFLPAGVVRPYVGVGVNATLIMKDKIAVPGVGALTLDDFSLGVAGQVGADVQVRPGQFINFDVKKVTIGSDVKSAGTTVSKVKVDPWLLSVGYGFRF
ncbi:MAG: OmpW family protein [Gemmatimonadaceae bacterium]|nr:OmpW family protein [Gemmatimonadaceae bacterium]